MWRVGVVLRCEQRRGVRGQAGELDLARRRADELDLAGELDGGAHLGQRRASTRIGDSVQRPKSAGCDVAMAELDSVLY